MQVCILYIFIILQTQKSIENTLRQSTLQFIYFNIGIVIIIAENVINYIATCYKTPD